MNLRIGRYRLLKRLALGGMAEIWLARQGGAEGFEKLVVIKRILPHLAENPEFVQMFLDEARLVAHLAHPNIAQIYDLGFEDRSYFIAMEYVHGENLRTVQKRRAERVAPTLPGPLAARITAFAAQALAHAHGATDQGGRPLNVVHRDVSPQNLLVGYDGQVKVVDFGIAKAATRVGETRTGVLKGKYAYMSPEQCKGEPLDGRSDLFALGVVLWEMVTGKRLFNRNTEMATFLAICDEAPQMPSELGIPVDPGLEEVIAKSLAKQRDDRYADGYEMADAIERYLRGTEEPVTQRQIGAEMGRLFEDRIAAWQQLLQGSAAEVDEALMAARSDLFQIGTPSHLSSPSGFGPAPGGVDAPAPPPAPSDPAADALIGAETVIREPVAPPAQPPLPDLGSAPTVPRPPSPGEAPEPIETVHVADDAYEDEVATGGGHRGMVIGGLVAVVAVAAVGAFVWSQHQGGSKPSLPVAEATPTPRHPATPVKPTSVPKPPPVKPTPTPTPPPAKPAPAPTPPPAKPTPKEAPAKPTPKPAPVKPAPTPPPAKPPAPKHRRHRSTAPGRLTFNAKPWCRVTLDGRALGTTPLAGIAVRPGTHHLVCAGPGGARRALTLHVRAGETLRRVVSFVPGHLAFRIKPWGHVTVDGHDLGITPLPAESVTPGAHQVVVDNKKLGVHRRLTVHVDAGRTHVVDLDLRH